MAFAKIRVSEMEMSTLRNIDVLPGEILQHHFAAACPQRRWVTILNFLNLIFNRSQTKLSWPHSTAICQAIPALPAALHYGARVELYI